MDYLIIADLKARGADLGATTPSPPSSYSNGKFILKKNNYLAHMK